uniref:WW domain-containing protein n=1 Tax=viral metagenome TaxID=1070528 RepID=A0A6C0H304_9ZZZZ
MELCWKTAKSKSKNREYYINIEKGVSQWGESKSELPLGWEAHISHKVLKGATYYGNVSKNIRQWEIPTIEDEKPLPTGWEKKVSRCKNVYYVNNNLNRSQWEIPRPFVFTIPDYEPISIAPRKIIDEPRALKWTKNSCYLDSALFAFFAGPKKFIDQLLNMKLEDKTDRMILGVCNGQDWKTNILSRKAIQQELKNIYNSITRNGKEVEYCTNLRRTLVNCPDAENYHTGAIADAGEFITYINNIFPTDKSIKKTITYGTNRQGINLSQVLEEDPNTYMNDSLDEIASLVHVIQVQDILDIGKRKDVYLSDFLVEKFDSKLRDPFNGDGTLYYRRIQFRTIDFSPYLIFSLKRLPKRDSKITTNIVNPDKYIKIGDDDGQGQMFTLTGVVINTGSCHYVAVAKYNNFWWYYDDQEYSRTKKLRKFNTFDEFVTASKNSRGTINNPLTHGTQFYYSPVDID